MKSKSTKEIITATFEFAIEYDTEEGRKECLKMVSNCEKRTTVYATYGTTSVKISKKKGIIK